MAGHFHPLSFCGIGKSYGMDWMIVVRDRTCDCVFQHFVTQMHSFVFTFNAAFEFINHGMITLLRIHSYVFKVGNVVRKLMRRTPTLCSPIKLRANHSTVDIGDNFL